MLSGINLLRDESSLEVNDVRDDHQYDDPVLLGNRLPVATSLSLNRLYSQSGTLVDRSIVSDNAFPGRGEGMPEAVTTLPLYLRVLACFTMYGELSAARIPEDFAPVRTRMQQEWKFNGVFLLTLAAVNAAVFAISPDAIFRVNSCAYTAVATSSAACGLGVACDVWFLLRYNWVDLRTFIYRSRDVYGLYVFFSMSSRIPSLCTLVGSISFMTFVVLVAYDAGLGVLAIVMVVFLVMTLQFLVYGVHRSFISASNVWRAVTLSIVTAVQSLKA